MKKKGQSLAEYVIVATMIAAVLISMSAGFRRSIQRVVKNTADLIGMQSQAEQALEPARGYLVESKTDTETASKIVINEMGGSFQVTDYREVETKMKAKTYQGN